jgi:hypothetical protein
MSNSTYGGKLEEQKQRIEENLVELSSCIEDRIFEAGHLAGQQFRAVLRKGRSCGALSRELLLQLGDGTADLGSELDDSRSSIVAGSHGG